MKIKIQVFIIFLLGALVLGCEKMDTDFKEFLEEHEIIYPGRVSKVLPKPGNLRIGLSWISSPDPSVTKYIIYWNNKADSIVVNADESPSEAMEVIIPDLDEYIYSFTIFSYDAKGNRSIPLEVNNVRVYGPLYQSGILNRSIDTDNPYVVYDDGTVRLNFNSADTTNVSTSILYTSTSDEVVERKLAPDSSSIILENYQSGTDIHYRSSYMPSSDAIDTFYVKEYSLFPKIFKYVECDKSLFKEVQLLNDVGVYEGGTSVSKLWDGSVGPQGYPNIFHSDGDNPLPHHFTFDLGKVYENLSHIEQTGRDCCNNPDRFEVWGIADITGAETTLPSNDPGWKDEALEKGWTLLKEVQRVDDGANPLKVELMDSPPSVRYIRIRVIHVTSNDANYSNMSELTFWNKE